MAKKMCKVNLEDCDFKDWLTAMELRQKSFEDRQAVNERRITETRDDVAIIKRDFEAHMVEHKHISERININTKQLTDIRGIVEPIHEGVHAIQESVKVFTWIANAVKWIGATVAGTALIIYGWFEYIADLLKAGN